ncbi:MAG TPA: MMPL family transporter [Steroidobacteraceae bacterium]|jgi:hypothetical protein|nr:MMPL family transporter [Steroidobacteraceae bacterium]
MIVLVVRLVEFSRRYAPFVAAFLLLAVVAIGALALPHLGIDTDTGKLFNPNLPWRQAEERFDRAFPQNDDVLAIVIDAATPDQAQDAATVMTRELSAKPDLFREVRQPTGGEFFKRNGLLLLSTEQVQKIADELISAQPLLGTLAADPSARGVLDALDLMAQGPLQADTPVAALAPPFRAVGAAVESALAGQFRPLSWQTLLTNGGPSPGPSLQVVVAKPALNYQVVEPGRKAIEAIHALAEKNNLNTAHGVRVRVTGPVALNDDQLSALREGAGLAAGVSLGLLVFWLALTVRSARAVIAILTTLIAGLVLCAAVAAAFVGPFNPISIAFAPLFIGIAIDFGIQFCVRYAAEREGRSTAEALQRTARGVGLPLVVAGAATAVGFLSLSPTDYRGVSDLGVIAGSGMIIALFLNLTLLPALLQLLRVGGFKEAAGIARAAPLDGWLVGHRKSIGVAVAVVTALCLGLMVRLHFDFDPIDLENPKAESVQALFDLMKDPDTSPYTLDALAPDPAAATDLAHRLAKLPEVEHAVWLGSFVPDDQQAKLDILQDARDLLSPTLSPQPKPAPSPDQVLASASHAATDIGLLGSRGDQPSAQLSDALSRAVRQGDSIVPLLSSNLAQGIGARLDDMRTSLNASAVTIDSIPPEVKRDWIGTDGRYDVKIFMKGSARDPKALQRFVKAVRAVAPDTSGTPIGIQESGNTVMRAFAVAGVLATAAITILLALVLRSVRDVGAVLGPLMLAILLTLATCAIVGMPLNFANIVTLPLLLGIGVAFDIYFVLRWRAGEHGLLGSPTARAIVFSALTTGTAFGSLALSQSPGMADMGKLLSIGLFFTLICTLFVLPALLGTAPQPQPQAGHA